MKNANFKHFFEFTNLLKNAADLLSKVNGTKVFVCEMLQALGFDCISRFFHDVVHVVVTLFLTRKLTIEIFFVGLKQKTASTVAKHFK